MMADGRLAPLLGDLFGTGPGAGMAVMFAATGVLTALVGLAGYVVPLIRNVEDILPDHDAAKGATAGYDQDATEGTVSDERESEFARGAASMEERASRETEAGIPEPPRASGDGRSFGIALVLTGVVAALSAVIVTLGVVAYLNDGSLEFVGLEAEATTEVPAAEDGAPEPSVTAGPTGSAEPVATATAPIGGRSDRPLATATLRIIDGRD
jgi:hypothetical protein